MRTFRSSAPILMGAGAPVTAFLAPAPPSLGAGETSAKPEAAAKASVTALASLADLKNRLDPSDRDMALRALNLALNEIADGATLVWKRPSQELEGRIMAVSAFRDDQGRVCRRVIYGLTLGKYESSAEGIACRQSDGRWSLDG
jgi:surface antigen